MGFYADVILPRLCDRAMRDRRLVPYRARVAAAARGRVLEIGLGSGLNLPFYGAEVRSVVGLDPSPPLLAMAERAGKIGPRPVELLAGSAEAIPLERASVDTVLMTWTLCSIPHTALALAEIARVLKPGGELLMCEHGAAPDPGVARWQARLTPLWRRLAGGCHLDRDPEKLLHGAGFAAELRCGYMPGVPRLVGYMYEGRARPR